MHNRTHIFFALLVSLVFCSSIAQAEIQYITDQVSTTLRANPVGDGKQVGKPLSSGNPVEVVLEF